MKEFKRGDQIKYNPGHCKPEYGFVTEVRGEVVFCRFWSNFQGGELRTIANSESCNPRDIKLCRTNIPHVIIDAWLKHLGYEF